MKTESLPEQFTGIGEVRGFQFTKEIENEHGYIYKVTDEGRQYYEVFEKRSTPLCIDYENKIFSETDFKDVYPKSNAFGIWAWTLSSLVAAKEILMNIEHKFKNNDQ